MRYAIEQIDLVLAEYVIGTLTGRARQRVDALMRERSDVRQRVWFYERTLGTALEQLPPVQPRATVWAAIEQRTAPTTATPARRSWWQPLFIALPLAAALTFMALLLNPSSPPASFDRVAVFADAQAQTQWLVQAELASGRLSVGTRGAPPIDAGQTYELWALPDNGAPRSLGLINAVAGEQSRVLDPAVIAALGQSASLAISIEPAGGSPTGAPTGPVIGQAAFVVLK